MELIFYKGTKLIRKQINTMRINMIRLFCYLQCFLLKCKSIRFPCLMVVCPPAGLLAPVSIIAGVALVGNVSVPNRAEA